MVENSDEPGLLESPKPHASPIPLRADDKRPAPSLGQTTRRSHAIASNGTSGSASYGSSLSAASPNTSPSDAVDDTKDALPPPAPPPPETGHGEASATIESDAIEEKPNIALKFYQVCKEILFSGWLNVLLVFVPAGIAVHVAGVDPNIVFAINAIAIIPLAGLLSHATESVASDMGDTIGSLMNITFGNAVELIIFIALTKNEIRIVQASLLGSILANLLLILGMCFLFGGLRFREQVYNNTVTQMSACLLSLSVMSLLLPTAFHASFTDNTIADKAVLQVSRGTSIILLLVYVLYLLFQLKSHAYMYQSTPQSIIDEESHPGLLHDMLNSSSSSDSSSSSSSTDSDDSKGSNTTAKRIKRVLRGRKRRKSSASSKENPSIPSTLRTPSAGTFDYATANRDGRSERATLGAIASGDEADTDGENDMRSRGTRDTTINFRDFENEKRDFGSKSPEIKKKKKTKKKLRKNHKHDESEIEMSEKPSLNHRPSERPSTPRPKVGFVQDVSTHESSPKRPFNLRGLSVREIVPTMPAVQNMLSSTVFSTANPTGIPSGGVATTGITPRALHRSNSLPSRLNQVRTARHPPAPPQPQANDTTVGAAPPIDSQEDKVKQGMSRTAAILLLLVSTGLVAVCADFLVESIDHLVASSSISEAFIGLIIIPIVGNAAEHVTAVTVASKNKMDLAIGVAVGSSIQIALFVTPVIVLLGWILNKDMSLYFSLFETISLFVSAFIVNFLVLDGRSNYLEGALLIAAYVIIALGAFFYPDQNQQSTIGGAEQGTKLMLKRAVVEAVDAVTARLF